MAETVGQIRATPPRRARAAFLLAAAVIAANAAAQTYPTRPIKLIVPFAAGSATDAVSRILADELGRRLGENVVVENKPGAFGQIAAVAAARSAPDGYTLFVTTNTSHSANPHLFKSLPYDPVKDFEPIARIGRFPFVLAVNPGLPVKSTAELIAYARANPGKLSYATANSTSLVVAETMNTMAKVSIVGVPYKASPQAILDLVSGQVQVMATDLATALPQIKAGRLRALAVTSAKRTALLPELPPMGDALKGFDVNTWVGLFAPAGTPKDVVARVAKETLAILPREDVKARLANAGTEVDPLAPEPFARYVNEQLGYWGKLVREAGIQPE